MYLKDSQSNDTDFILYLKNAYKYTDIEIISKNDRHILYKAKLKTQFNIIKRILNPEQYNNIEYEYSVIKYVSSKLPKSLKKIMPKLKVCNSLKGYYIYYYIRGETFGNYSEVFGIRHGVLNDAIINDLFTFVVSIEKISVFEDSPYIKSFGRYIFDREVAVYSNHLVGVIDKDTLKSAVTLLAANREVVYFKRVISHMDMYPNNLIKTSAKRSDFKIIDWEKTSYVALGYSFAFLYLALWREDFWKYKLFGLFYNHYKSMLTDAEWRTFKKVFRLFIVLISLRFIYQLSKIEHKNDNDYINAFKSNYYALTTALDGSILKPRYIKFIINKEDIIKILSYYNIDKFLDYKVYYTGHGNSVIRIKLDNDCRIIRIYSPSRQLKLVKREVKMFETLTAADINTYQVFKTGKGEKVCSIHLYGIKRYVVLLSYLKGSRITKKWANKKSVFKLGKMLKNIHCQNITHGDFSKENVLFNKSQPFSVIDFEWGKFTKSEALKLSDLTRAIMLWIVDSRYKAITDNEFIEIFLEGYYGFKPNSKIKAKVYKSLIESIKKESLNVTGDDNILAHKRFANPLYIVQDLLKSL